ncbi:hypothetical protein IFM89_036703 [Coptis chinensis]|uniref:Uncharacterized protein n=1 Tax=Coptis chinensis TaxID=261450 RepID=A0A835M8B9_9MAGN|nr:hypothetical protein IFM89_036703 [Coptis chinensis]
MIPDLVQIQIFTGTSGTGDVWAPPSVCFGLRIRSSPFRTRPTFWIQPNMIPDLVQIQIFTSASGTDYIHNYRRPTNFKKPDFEMYDEENGDPYTHLFYYRSQMAMENDDALLWIFAKGFKLYSMLPILPRRFIIQAFKDAIGYDRSGLYNSLTRQPPFSKSELFDSAEEFARVEDDLKARQL